MIKGFTPRLYQETILATATQKNTLVVLPTGMGKTNIFLMLAAQRLKQYPKSKILFIGPTRPLVEQYIAVFKKNFEIKEDEMAVFTGFVKPEKRAELWKQAKVIFSTPQGLENDIISKRINLEDISLLGVDEAHRAVGDYAYVFVAKKYQKTAQYPRILALTASPGSDLEKIAEVCRNLFIEEIEVRTQDDPDVKPYVQQLDIKWISVDLPESFVEIKNFLSALIREKITRLRNYGMKVGLSKKDLLSLQAKLYAEISKGEKDFMTFKAVSLLAEIIKAQHALELLETQGITALHKYFDKLQQEALSTKSKAVKRLVSDLNFKSAFVKTNSLFEKNIEHPKISELKLIMDGEVQKNKDTKIIVFNNYRDSATKLVEELNKIKGVTAKIFVGQMKKGETGLSQKEQKAILEEFREGKVNVIVATSIGEEGLDIPKVDLVIFYEPVPSAIRHIQRRGRTGRLERGRVIVLVTKNTRDEAFRWVAHHKEKRMFRNLKGLKQKLKLQKHPDQNLKDFLKQEKDTIRIMADTRENSVLRHLSELGATVELKKLDVADYLCSSNAAVEVKKVADFVNSIIDGRLLSQLRDLKTNFEKPIIIIEGEEDIYSVRKIHPNAIRGMLATIAASYNIPMLHSKNSIETAALLMAIAKREQKNEIPDFELHAKKPLTTKEQQEFIVSSFPGVEKTIAKNLLKRFRTIKNVVDAEEKNLKDTKLIGKKKAADIRKVLDEEYAG